MTAERDRPVDVAGRFVAEIPAAVALFDRELRYVAASAPWVAAFGLAGVAPTGRRHAELGAVGEAALADVQQRALAGADVEHHPIVADGRGHGSWRGTLAARPYRGPDGSVVGVIVAAHIAAPAAAAWPAPEAAAGLAERQQFVRRLREVLAAPDTERGAVAVFAINLDGFRDVNNLHGVAIGDRVLGVTADRLISATRSRRSGEGEAARPRDSVARLGADEFGIICETSAIPSAEAGALAARLLRIVQSPIAIGPRSLRLTASIGFLIPTPAHRHQDDVLRDLDLALRRAKTLGPNKVIAWEPALTEAATQRYSLAEQLQRAFEEGEFLLHYQPVLRLSDQRMIGAEALLRWNHPSEGLVTSTAFLPVLEETGQIDEVGCWAIREVVRQIESWRILYGRDIVDWVSVNLSRRQFDDPTPLLAALRAIHEGGFPVHRLRLEIAETTLARNPAATQAVFGELRELGIRLAVDDFGTGFSSLRSLRHYPVDAIKIDAEFVAMIGSEEGEKLAQALLDIARVPGATIVAEGIETEAQRDFLREAGCDFGQGYLFAEPMDGALLGAYALTHAVAGDARPAPGRASAAAINPPTSAGPLRAG